VLSTGAPICDYCLEGHLEALDVLGGAVPKTCQGCGEPWKHLQERDPYAIAVRMYIVPKDGILQMLCARCTDAYTHKRTDLYKGTQFGAGL